jgi:(R,R)-butanediol dehydrogenase/meso-butanediol dehydrogenase/diacetyl reductase
MCYKLPPSVAQEVGTLAEPTSVAVRANRLARTSLGDTVAVVGAGTIGLLCLETARLSGASHVHVIEIEESRRAVARQLGADEVIDPLATDPVEAVKTRTEGLGADIVIEAGGNAQTMALAPQLARKQGRVVLLGLHNEPIPINLFPVVCEEIELVGSFSHIYDEDFAAAVTLLGDGRIDTGPLITGRIGLNDMVAKGLEELIANKAENLKILVTPEDANLG